MLFVGEILGVLSIKQERLFVWKSHWKQLGWACELGGVKSHGITREGANSVSQVDGVSNVVPACWLFVCIGAGNLRKETTASANTSFWQRAAHPKLSP